MLKIQSLESIRKIGYGRTPLLDMIGVTAREIFRIDTFSVGVQMLDYIVLRLPRVDGRPSLSIRTAHDEQRIDGIYSVLFENAVRLDVPGSEYLRFQSNRDLGN